MEDYIVHVLDRDGAVVDVSHFRATSLLSAALIGHAFQIQDGYVVTITDASEVPNKHYAIDAHGKPIEI